MYDKVDEQEYAKLVTERREAGVGFVVDDDGFGYADIGEEDDWGGAEARGGCTRRCAGQGAQMAGPNILVWKIAAKPPVRGQCTVGTAMRAVWGLNIVECKPRVA